MWGVVGAGNSCCLGQSSLQNKTEVQLPHKLLVFEMFSNGLVGQVCDWKRLIPKARMYS
jgi:hypothetical protein